MNDVEKYWEAIRSKCSPTVPPWNELDPQAQTAYRDWETDRKSTRLNSSHLKLSRMPSSA